MDNTRILAARHLAAAEASRLQEARERVKESFKDLLFITGAVDFTVAIGGCQNHQIDPDYGETAVTVIGADLSPDGTVVAIGHQYDHDEQASGEEPFDIDAFGTDDLVRIFKQAADDAIDPEDDIEGAEEIDDEEEARRRRTGYGSFTGIFEDDF